MIFKMSYLLTELNKLEHSKIDLRDNPTHYKVYYTYSHDIKSIGITFQCSNIKFIKIDTIKYAIINLSSELIKQLINIDKHIKSSIPHYSGIVSALKNGKMCILFNENDIVKQVFKENHDTLCLNFKYITKGYNNNPVLHIIR